MSLNFLCLAHIKIWAEFIEHHTAFLFDVHQGWNRSQFSTSSYYIHVKEGWANVAEGAFPELIGWVMEVYGMEGVREWVAEN